MPLRIWIELLVLCICITIALIIYFYAKRKIDAVQSDMTIRKKKDIKEKLED